MTRSDEMVAVVEARSVCAAYGTIQVLDDVSLQVRPGAVHAVLGANGAGKSTLLEVMAGLHPCTSGEVLMRGVRADGADPAALARAGVCLVPGGRGVFPNLTVSEHLWLIAGRRGHRREIEDAVFSRFPRLGERRRNLAGTLSGGEQQMLALARALVGDPAVVLLDELSHGLAPVVVERLYEAVACLAAGGVSIVVVEQFATLVLGVADTATVLARGRVVLDGPASAVKERIAEAYFGE